VYRCAGASHAPRGRARIDVTTVAGKCQLKNDYLGLPDDDPLLLPVSPPLLVPVLPLLLEPLALLLAEPDAPLSGLAGAAWARP